MIPTRTPYFTPKTTVESVPPSCTMQQTFEYLRDHLRVELVSPRTGTVAVRLLLTNPATQKLELIEVDLVQIS